MSPVSCMSPLEITFWAWDREFPELHLCSCAYHLVLISLLFLFPVPVTSSCSTADIGSFDLKPFFNFFLYVSYPKDSSSVAWNSHGSPLFLFLPLILIMASLLGVLWFISCIRHQNANPALQTLCLEQRLAFTWCSAEYCRKGEELVSSSTSDLVLGTFWNSVVCFLEVSSFFCYTVGNWNLPVPTLTWLSGGPLSVAVFLDDTTKSPFLHIVWVSPSLHGPYGHWELFTDVCLTA